MNFPRSSQIASILLACVVFFTGCGKDENRFSQPPIILISIDTLRADRLPAYGSSRIATPAIDRLAADGIVFENAYAQVPLTLPSHASMITGNLPYKTGVRSNIGYRLLPESGPALPKLLADRGYATGGVVSAYVLRAETGLDRKSTRLNSSHSSPSRMPSSA